MTTTISRSRPPLSRTVVIAVVATATAILVSQFPKRQLAVYLPLMEGGAARGLKGVALVDWGHKEDLETLGASVYYGWGQYCKKDARCLNMTRDMSLPKECYSNLLVGNEPDLREPYGYPLTPTEATRRVIAIEKECPSTWLVVGNISQAGRPWLVNFLREYESQAGQAFSQALGVHCYGSSKFCIDYLGAIQNIYSGEFWLTEYNTLNDSEADMQRLTDYASHNFAYYFAYSNRQSGHDFSLRGADLVNHDGTLTNVGLGFAAGGK